MRSILAIFRKDLRCLWPVVALYWALLVVAAIADPFGGHGMGGGSQFSVFALLVCICLTVEAIHQEPLPGDRQYWRTRPLTGRQLLAAKALFVVSCVVIPALIYQIAVLIRLGIAPGDYPLVLAERQLHLAASVLLPVAAVAAVTRNLRQFVGGWLLVLAALIGVALLPPSHRAVTWIAPAWLAANYLDPILVVVGMCLVFLQYRPRATTAGRLMLATSMVLLIFGVKVEAEGGPATIVRATVAPPNPREAGQFKESYKFAIPREWTTLGAGVHGYASPPDGDDGRWEAGRVSRSRIHRPRWIPR